MASNDNKLKAYPRRSTASSAQGNTPNTKSRERRAKAKSYDEETWQTYNKNNKKGKQQQEKGEPADLKSFYANNRHKASIRYEDVENVIPASQPLTQDKLVDHSPPQTIQEQVEEISPAASSPLQQQALPIHVPSTQPDQSEQWDVEVEDDIAATVAEDSHCPVCREEVQNGQPGIYCEMCYIWSHRSCLHMTEAIYEDLMRSPDPWYCIRCLSLKSNKIRWGEWKVKSR